MKKTAASTVLAALAAFAASGIATAADAPAAAPPAKATRAAKPSARGPGTQTEDELYIGAKARTPQKVKAKPTAPAKTGDEDLDDLEVQRVGAKPNAK